MSDPNFDPYHEWLGIPPDEQPANHYRLLGLELFETDRGVIKAVSLEQIAHVRTFAIGARSEQSQLLLNELSAARVTLLNVLQKAEYDHDLRQQLNIAPPPVEVISESTQQAVTTPQPEYEAPLEAPNPRLGDPASSDAVSKQSLYISIGAGIGLTVVIFVCVMLYLRSQKLNEAVYQALNQGDYEGALELDPGNEQARAMQRTADLIRFALDRRDYREVLRLDPTNAQGLELKKASDLRRALADGDFARALLLDPGNPEAIKMRSSALEQALADGDYARALKIDPTNPEALGLKKSAELRQALEKGDYARALGIDPANPEALAMKDAAELRQALADGDYARALKIDPTNPEALGLKKSAELRQALEKGDYARALEIDPANPAALAMKRGSASAPEKAIAPFDAAKAKEYQEAWAKYLGVEVETENSIGMKLSVIPAGMFTMGEDGDVHEVTLTKPFMLGTYEVTQDQYQQVMEGNPSSVKGATNPVEQVSWNDAVEFCRKLSELPAEKAAGNVYRLPTEAEWAFACRAGTTTRYSFGDNASDFANYSWFWGNSDRKAHPVGIKQTNALGLHDMHGNVWEWCRDWYGSYPSGAVTDPTGAATGSLRVHRGGGWNFATEVCGSAVRFGEKPSNRDSETGFRVCLSPSSKQVDTNTELADMASDANDTNPPPANAPFDATKAKEYQKAWASYLGVEVETENSIGMKLSVIPPGTFTIGSDDGRNIEKPRHQVTLTKPFMLGTHEVTQGQYQRVIGTNPSRFKGVNNPVEMVSWTDAVEFCRRLSALPAEKAAGRVYRLPTEAQWEHACRAGTTTKYSFGDDESDLGDYAWYNANSRSTTHPVGGKLPNALGLHDMHGNVFEWCQDWHGAYPDRAVTDPTGTRTGSTRVGRGGGWINAADFCGSAFRFRDTPSNRYNYDGFRVCLSLSGKQVDASTDLADMAPKGDGTNTLPAAPAPANAPFDTAKAKEHQEAWAKYLGVEVETENSIGMMLSVIPAGTFTMGEKDDAHAVTLTKPFMLGTYEVTQGQYQRVMGTNASRFKGVNNPVEMVSWTDAVEFCRRLSALPAEKAAGRVYRLPTEAQWEHACRAGTTTKYSFGDDESDLGDYAWYNANSRSTTHPVGGKLPNAWGLYDMYGNVWEWCQDWEEDYPSGSVTDPSGATSGTYRMFRGGSWINAAEVCRSAIRHWNRPSVRGSAYGFRVSLSPSGK